MKTLSAHTLAIATLSTSTFAVAALVVFFALPTYAEFTDNISSVSSINELTSYQTK